MDNRSKLKDDDDDVPLPGFRFYPTDEELVGFYLRRKVEKRPISMELIKQIDIYKFDPWDLPKASTVGDNEWYFYCKRGRKYRNSVRPNRVTGSGFWKATGIDKPIYSADHHHQGEARRDCIGLKKSLVYYRGNAGKGTKTDWMMHEFRLPDQTNALEAEVWTLCRIFKRNVAYRKYTSNWREISTKREVPTETSSKTCSVESATKESNYISFRADPIVVVPQNDKKPNIVGHISTEWPNQYYTTGQLLSSSVSQSPLFTASSPSFSNMDGKNDFFTNDNCWDELSSVLGFSVNRHSV